MDWSIAASAWPSDLITKSLMFVTPRDCIFASRFSRYFGNRAYPPGRNRSVHVVTGTKFIATQFVKFCASTPAENEIGIVEPAAARNLSTRFRVRTCRGAPDRYIVASVKNV